MKLMRFLALPALLATAAFAQDVNGLWDAQIKANQLDIPFRMELSTKGNTAKGFFFNGEERVASTAGTFDGKTLELKFDHYATALHAELKDGQLTGTYDRGSRGSYAFQAKHFVPSALTAADVPSIAGLWEIGGVHSAKGESAWKLIVRQSGPEVTAAVLRIDGDTGALSGTWKDGKFVLSHFSGARPSLFELKPASDGTLQVTQNGTQTYTAVRSSIARAKGLPAPADPSRHTSVLDPTQPFRFSGKDLQGQTVTNLDPKFRGKVVIVALGGSWCPNCHDEAPFLAQLYKEYRAQGLEIVGLSFEEQEQLQDLGRLHAFIKQYGIEYTVLVPGEPSELQAKIPQAVNLNSWPTTFFLGRDGKVRAVHAGFAGRASGALHEEMAAEYRATIEKLLGENLQTSRE